MSKFWNNTCAALSLSVALGLLAWVIHNGLAFWLHYQPPSPPAAHLTAPKAHKTVAAQHLFEATITPETLPLSAVAPTLQGIAYSADPAIPSQAIFSQGSNSHSLHSGETLPGSKATIVAILPNMVILREPHGYTRLPLATPATTKRSQP